MSGVGASGGGVSGVGDVAVGWLSEESAAETSRLAGVRAVCRRGYSKREAHDPGRLQRLGRLCVRWSYLAEALRYQPHMRSACWPHSLSARDAHRGGRIGYRGERKRLESATKER